MGSARCIRRGERCEYRVQDSVGVSELEDDTTASSIIRRTVSDPATYFGELRAMLVSAVSGLQVAGIIYRPRAYNTL